VGEEKKRDVSSLILTNMFKKADNQLGDTYTML